MGDDDLVSDGVSVLLDLLGDLLDDGVLLNNAGSGESVLAGNGDGSGDGSGDGGGSGIGGGESGGKGSGKSGGGGDGGGSGDGSVQAKAVAVSTGVAEAKVKVVVSKAQGVVAEGKETSLGGGADNGKNELKKRIELSYVI